MNHDHLLCINTHKMFCLHLKGQCRAILASILLWYCPILLGLVRSSRLDLFAVFIGFGTFIKLTVVH